MSPAKMIKDDGLRCLVRALWPRGRALSGVALTRSDWGRRNAAHTQWDDTRRTRPLDLLFSAIPGVEGVRDSSRTLFKPSYNSVWQEKRSLLESCRGFGCVSSPVVCVGSVPLSPL